MRFWDNDLGERDERQRGPTGRARNLYANKFRVFEINKKNVQTNINFYLSRRNGYNLCEFITKKINNPLIQSPLVFFASRVGKLDLERNWMI